MEKIDKHKIHKILVIRTDKIGRVGSSARYCGLGEALLNMPAIRALKQNFNSHIIAIVNPVVKEFSKVSVVICIPTINVTPSAIASIALKFFIFLRVKANRAVLKLDRNPMITPLFF